MTRFNRMGQNPYTESRILPVSLILLSPTLAALKYNLKSTLASRIALLANMPLAHIMGCSITANDSNQVSDF